MKRFRIVIVCLVVFVYVSCFLATNDMVRAVTVVITTDRAIYPIWGLGGTVRVTADGLPSNTPFYLWIQRSGGVANFTNLSFTSVNGASASGVLNLGTQTLPGTYLLTLSKSQTTDTAEVTAHFGVSGTDAAGYVRTMMVTVAGGGFVPNSTIVLTTQSLAGFPVNVTVGSDGGFSYRFKLAPSATVGQINVTLAGSSYDLRKPVTASSVFTVGPSPVKVEAVGGPVGMVERTLPASASYQLSYQDGSPVTTANASATLISGNQSLRRIPLVLVDAGLGKWNASWTPLPSTPNSTYHFNFDPANFTDSYGNHGVGALLESGSFSVIPARLQAVIQGPVAVQRTQNSSLTISALYPSLVDVANVTESSLTLTTSTGNSTTLKPSLRNGEVFESFKVPVNATTGNWTLTYRLQDPWGNHGEGVFAFKVESASITFQPQTPPTTQRTTILNVTNTAYYPDGDILISRPNVAVWSGNQTWDPTLTYDPATGSWTASLPIVQNATLGPYNITWATKDPYGNAGNESYTTQIIPAQFTFLVKANNSTTVPPLSNLDLPVVVRYPNGTGLTDSFGNVTGFYSNSSEFVFTNPLVYNATNATWHMYFTVPNQQNATLSFNATDRFGNTVMARDVFNLKIATVSQVVTRNLIIAGIVGSIVPIALLIWAFATISARRRKHKP